jgi:uncharacterized membrane protein
MAAFFGTALLCLPILALAWMQTDGTPRLLLIAASLVYLIGCIVVTGTGNVPLNEQLARLTSNVNEEAFSLWSHYLSRWTFWNHVRTMACILTSGLFVYVLWKSPLGQ